MGAAYDTGTEELLVRVEARVAVVTLNRPEARNALTPAMKEALARTIPALGADPEVGCVLLTGAGAAFCAGGDTRRMARDGRLPSPEERKRALRREHESPLALHRLEKPTIAALPGAACGAGGATRGLAGAGRLPSPGERKRGLPREHEIPLALRRLEKPPIAALSGAAAGAGLSLALACDLRIAAESAFVTAAYARLGLSGDYGGTWFLTRLVGPAKARELYFLGERVDARACERLGLVNRVVPDAALADEAFAWAARIAAGPPIALRLMKDN